MQVLDTTEANQPPQLLVVVRRWIGTLFNASHTLWKMSIRKQFLWIYGKYLRVSAISADELNARGMKLELTTNTMQQLHIMFILNHVILKHNEGIRWNTYHCLLDTILEWVTQRDSWLWQTYTGLAACAYPPPLLYTCSSRHASSRETLIRVDNLGEVRFTAVHLPSWNHVNSVRKARFTILLPASHCNWKRIKWLGHALQCWNRPIACDVTFVYVRILPWWPPIWRSEMYCSERCSLCQCKWLLQQDMHIGLCACILQKYASLVGVVTCVGKELCD